MTQKEKIKQNLTESVNKAPQGPQWGHLQFYYTKKYDENIGTTIGVKSIHLDIPKLKAEGDVAIEKVVDKIYNDPEFLCTHGDEVFKQLEALGLVNIK